MTQCVFLTPAEAMKLHQKVIAHSGGDDLLLDLGKLESALAQPMQSFGGSPLFPSITDKAAAYLFFVAKAHAFADGNKRVAVVVTATFLQLNGFRIHASTDEFEKLVMDIVGNNASKEDAAEFFRTRVHRM